MLTIGAAIVAALPIANLINQDKAHQRFALVVLCCEILALALALVSMKRLNKLFWVGGGIHAALSVMRNELWRNRAH